MPIYHEVPQILLIDDNLASEQLLIGAAWRGRERDPIGEKQPCFQALFSVLEAENIRKH